MMQLKDLPKIDDKYFDFNYNVPLVDLANTTACREGYCNAENDRLIKSMLHIFGMDVNRPYERLELADGQTFRSPITNLEQTGGYIYSGYERSDEAWKKRGKDNMVKYLFGYNEEFFKALGLKE
jgi:hypothetical protein